jgi:hypothetical protein
MNMEQWWNDSGRVKPKNSEKSLPQYHFVHQKSHMDRPGREPGPPRWERPATNRLSHGTAFKNKLYLNISTFTELNLSYHIKFKIWTIYLRQFMASTYTG